MPQSVDDYLSPIPDLGAAWYRGAQLKDARERARMLDQRQRIQDEQNRLERMREFNTRSQEWAGPDAVTGPAGVDILATAQARKRRQDAEALMAAAGGNSVWAPDRVPDAMLGPYPGDNPTQTPVIPPSADQLSSPEFQVSRAKALQTKGVEAFTLEKQAAMADAAYRRSLAVVKAREDAAKALRDAEEAKGLELQNIGGVDFVKGPKGRWERLDKSGKDPSQSAAMLNSAYRALAGQLKQGGLEPQDEADVKSQMSDIREKLNSIVIPNHEAPVPMILTNPPAGWFGKPTTTTNWVKRPKGAVIGATGVPAPASAPVLETPSEIPQPATKAEYDALPVGARYRHPDGSIRVKK